MPEALFSSQQSQASQGPLPPGAGECSQPSGGLENEPRRTAVRSPGGDQGKCTALAEERLRYGNARGAEVPWVFVAQPGSPQACHRVLQA